YLRQLQRAEFAHQHADRDHRKQQCNSDPEKENQPWSHARSGHAASKVRKDLGNLAEQVVAISSRKLVDIGLVPPFGAVIADVARMARQGHDARLEPRIEEERKGEPRLAAGVEHTMWR